MHSKSCARQLCWGLIWVAAPFLSPPSYICMHSVSLARASCIGVFSEALRTFHAHSLWLSICCAPWGLCTQIHHRQMRPPHRTMCVCTVRLCRANCIRVLHQEITLVYTCRIRMRIYVIKSLNDIYMSNNFWLTSLRRIILYPTYICCIDIKRHITLYNIHS